MGATLVIMVNYLTYVHTDFGWAGDSLFYLFFAVVFLLGVAYFTHFFALQKGAVLLHLFPKANIGKWKTYNPWLLFGLSISLGLVTQIIQFPRGEVFIHFSQLIICAAAIHVCFMAMQQLLLQKYKRYFPSFFSQKPFPSIGFMPFLSWLFSAILFVLFVFLMIISSSNDELIVFILPLMLFAIFMGILLGIFYIALHIQAEKHSVDNKTFKIKT